MTPEQIVKAVEARLKGYAVIIDSWAETCIQYTSAAGEITEYPYNNSYERREQIQNALSQGRRERVVVLDRT
jgi:DNA-binding NarL/FixJ family response regulator